MKNYDPTKESKFILYLDENNLYRWGIYIDESISSLL